MKPVPSDVVIFHPADEQAGEAAGAVEERDHLRHGGHLHPLRGDRADGRTDDRANDDPLIVQAR